MKSVRSWALLASLCIACGYPDGATEPPAVDEAAFASDVYPILLRDCGFPACHGAAPRFFRVYGPGRSRLLDTTHPYDPATEAEIAQSLTRARSMLEGVSDVDLAPLLRKPLSLAAGGAGHEGDDGWGQSVYASTKNPAYQTLRAWAHAMSDSDEGTP